MNEVKDSDLDSEGEPEDEDAMDLDADVGSSHPNVGSIRQLNLSKSLFVHSPNYPTTPQKKSVKLLFNPHPTSFCPVPKYLAEILIPRIRHSNT